MVARLSAVKKLVGGPSVLKRARAQIKTSVTRTFREEARRNELGIAYARAALLASAAGLGWLFDFVIEPGSLPNAWIEDTLLSAFFLGSLALACALRRGWYWKGLRFLVPVGDSSLILCYFLFIAVLHDPAMFVEYGLRTTLALVSAVLAVSGCARLDPKVAYLTTGLSVGVYGVVTGWFGWTQVDAFAAAGLLAVGYLGVWLTRVVRRAADGRVARGTLRRFLPRTVVRRAHDDPLKLLAEPRALEMTIVVTDVRGFTSFAEKSRPALVFRVLNEIQGTMADIVHRHAGTVDKFTGDGMLAVFGLSEARHHADDALAAVMEMRRTVAQLRKTVSALADLELQLGIGVHSGTAHVGCIGSSARLEFTVVGDVVNTAFRLQDLTKDMKVDLLISPETVTRAHDAALHFRSLGRVVIRGRDQDLEVFAIE